ncbi:sulfatase family protein [Tautonia sociabilis]|uniref:Sulfatase n=1 Tax=Tautonia sociabilis TaxID=2080755 RepID=A0A432MQU3_9BACT|nr:sulfatase [Tautonia sociabilis]RUL89507.1 sulfatase [Tautonia sociabilis]
MRLAALLAPIAYLAAGASAADDRPNIVWIIAEDMSPHFGCYGEKTIATPNVDRLASEGVRFANAFVTAPVCSPSRSALITGMYQTTIGAHHHRSGRGALTISLPSPVEPVPELFRAAGYHVSNGTIDGRPGKTDYNFEYDDSLYDGSDWSGRAEGQPFFAQLQLHGGKLRHAGNWAERAERVLGSLTDPESVTLPPYYPRDPVILEDWARYLDTVRYTDLEVGRILDRLDSEGLSESTYIFFITDHGISHARGKQFLYEEGIKIPVVVRGPGIEPGSVRHDLVAHIDLAAASLDLAGIPVPDWMQARPLFAEDHEPRPFVVSARDRCDETVDGIRSIRTDRYKLIRNLYPERPYLQPNAYKDHKEILIALRRLHDEGALNEAQLLQFAERRPRFELYDLEADPWELHDLARDPKHLDVVFGLRNELDRWMAASGDLGQQPEPEAMYDSDMAVYLENVRRNDPDRAAELEETIRLMKRWASEGK